MFIVRRSELAKPLHAWLFLTVNGSCIYFANLRFFCETRRVLPGGVEKVGRGVIRGSSNGEQIVNFLNFGVFFRKALDKPGVIRV